MLVDFVGTNPAKLISELNKVKHMADGKVFPWAVEQACYTDGDEEITEVVNLLTKGDHDGAHEYVDRIMSKNESFDRICGFLSSWLRRMAIAEAGSGDYKSVKDNLGLIMKYQKPLKSDVKVIRKLKEEIAMTSLMNTKVISKLMEKLEKEHEKTKTKAVQMFPKPGAMFYGCEQFNKACKYRSEQSLSRAWVMGLILFLLESQKKVRNGEADQRCVLHDFIMKFSHGVSYV
jgi:DNA polymerase III delta subunit